MIHHTAGEVYKSSRQCKNILTRADQRSKDCEESSRCMVSSFYWGTAGKNGSSYKWRNSSVAWRCRNRGCLIVEVFRYKFVRIQSIRRSPLLFGSTKDIRYKFKWPVVPQIWFHLVPIHDATAQVWNSFANASFRWQIDKGCASRNGQVYSNP